MSAKVLADKLSIGVRPLDSFGEVARIFFHYSDIFMIVVVKEGLFEMLAHEFDMTRIWVDCRATRALRSN